jgi:hypothetical protein
MRYHRFAVLPALLVAAPLSIAPASAGFFDSLFGAAAPAQAPSPGMNVTISPSASPSRSFHRPRMQAVQARRIAKPKAVRQLARHGSIDPSEDSQWFLHDSTLRPGDIVVLEREVLMLNNRPARGGPTRADFTSLDKGSAPADAKALLGSTIAMQSAAKEEDSKRAEMKAPETKAPEIKSASLASADQIAAPR